MTAEPSEVVASFTFAQVPDVVLYSKASDKAIRLFAVLHKHSTMPNGAIPGRKRVAELMNCSFDSVDRAIAELVAFGFLSVEPRWRVSSTGQLAIGPKPDEDAAQTSNYYVLLPQGGRKAAVGGSRVGAAGGGRKAAAQKRMISKENQDDPVRERAQEIRDLFADAFKGRRGNQSQQETIKRRCRQGATVEDFKYAIDVAKQEPRDDALAYALTIVLRCIKDRDNGDDPYRAHPGSSEGARGGGSRGDARGNRAPGRARDGRGYGRDRSIPVRTARQPDRLSPEEVARWADVASDPLVTTRSAPDRTIP